MAWPAAASTGSTCICPASARGSPAWRDHASSRSLRGLRQLGYSINLDRAGHPSRQADAALFPLPGGVHNQASWKQMLPLFLRWACGRH
jgi:hypothetical protein